MKIKRIISAFLSIVMAYTMAAGLSGCNNGGSNDTLLWYMVGDEPTDLAMVMEKANEIIEPKIGMKLEMKYIDAASFQEKMKLKMASGEAYDLTFAGYCNNYQNAVALGGLYDITELIDEVGLEEVIPEFYFDAAKVENKIYGIPNIQVVSNPTCIYIDENLAKTENIDMGAIQNAAQNAKTIDDLKAYAGMLDDLFAKVKAVKPDLYTFNPAYNLIITPVFETLTSGIVIRKDGSSTKLEKMVDTEEFMLGAQKLNEWYSKGYIRSDIASEGNALTSDDAERKIGVPSGTWKPGNTSYIVKTFGYEPEFALIGKPYVGRATALNAMTAVGANTKHPKEAVELIKLVNSDKELFNIICWGIEGTHYTRDEAGKVSEIKDSGYNDIGKNAWKYGNQFNALLLTDQPDGVWEETEKMNNTAEVSPMLGFVPDVTSISTEIANIATVEAEYKARKDYGTESPDTWFGEYKQKLETAGIDKVLAELQKQYDEFFANK